MHLRFYLIFHISFNIQTILHTRTECVPSSSSVFPCYISGVHHFGWDFCVCAFFVYVYAFFNPTIEVVTFCLCGWYTLGVFFIAGIHSSRTWMSGSFEAMQWNACVHRLSLGLHSHQKEFGGNGVRTHVNSKGNIPTTRKKPPQMRIEATTLHQAGRWAQNTTIQLFQPPCSLWLWDLVCDIFWTSSLGVFLDILVSSPPSSVPWLSQWHTALKKKKKKKVV